MSEVRDRRQRRELVKIEKRLRPAIRHVEAELPKGWGCAIVTFTYGEGGYLTYIANAEREDMIRALRECASTIEAKKDAPPGVLGYGGSGTA